MVKQNLHMVTYGNMRIRIVDYKKLFGVTYWGAAEDFRIITCGLNLFFNKRF